MLEESLLQHGFQPELQHYLSIESAKDSVQPWRYRSEGSVFSYFVLPSSEASQLRAVLALSERTGRLRLVVGGHGACLSEVFNPERQVQLEKLALTIGERFGRKEKFHYDAGTRC